MHLSAKLPGIGVQSMADIDVWISRFGDFVDLREGDATAKPVSLLPPTWCQDVGLPARLLALWFRFALSRFSSFRHCLDLQVEGKARLDTNSAKLGKQKEKEQEKQRQRRRAMADVEDGRGGFNKEGSSYYGTFQGMPQPVPPSQAPYYNQQGGYQAVTGKSVKALCAYIPSSFHRIFVCEIRHVNLCSSLVFG